MKIIKTKLKDLVLVKSKVFSDKRGFFKEIEKKNILVENHWAGFRPGSIKNIPIIKKDTNYENVFINSGHFRYGLTMAPKSAEIINSLLVKSEL